MIALEQAQVLYDTIVKKRAELSVTIPSFKTDCIFTHPNTGRQTDIRTLRNENVAVAIATVIVDSTSNTKEAAKLIGADEPKNVFLNQPTENWFHDLSIVVKKIKITNKRKELDELESQLKSLSPELYGKLAVDDLVAKINA